MSADIQYRTLAGYLGYRFGTDGSVWSCLARQGSLAFVPSDNWREIKAVRGTQRYYAVRIRKTEGTLHTKRVHQLIAAAFLGPCPPGKEVRHRNGNSLDNRSDNLCYGTRKENMQDCKSHGTSPVGEANSQAKLTEEEVLRIRHLSRSGMRPIEIIPMFNVSRSTIYAVIKGDLWGSVAEKARAECESF